MYALIGMQTNDILTFEGRPLTHGSRDEMEWLFPASRVVRVSDSDLKERSPLPPMPLSEHPALSHLSWPLKRSEFSNGGVHV